MIGKENRAKRAAMDFNGSRLGAGEQGPDTQSKMNGTQK